MTRRLIIAILGTTLAALLLAGLGTFALASIGARRNSEKAVTQQAADVAAGYVKIDSGVVVRPVVADAIRKIVRLDGVTFLREDKNGKLIGALPLGVPTDALDPTQLSAGAVQHGHRGRFVWAAAPSTAADGRMIVAVLVRKVTNGIQPAWRWFLVSSAAVMALGALVAIDLSRRLTRPIKQADQAARRIAAGELSTRLPEPRDDQTDELADLVRSVNSMAGSLQRSKAVEQEFLLSISHDLRTPLTSIRGYAEAISDGAASDPTWAAKVILKESRRLERLVADLLDLAKLQARSFSLHRQPVDLAAVAADAVAAFAGEFTEAGLQLTLDAAEQHIVSADRDRMAQVVANLLQNARKFARSQVRVSVRSVDGVAMLWVDDDGAGIAPLDRPHVFERLYRTSQEPLRAENSSGLGLAIVTELVNAMGGSVAAEEASGGGARLVIRFAHPLPGLGPGLVP
jgi:signal transduction histidine kinase